MSRNTYFITDGTQAAHYDQCKIANIQLLHTHSTLTQKKLKCYLFIPYVNEFMLTAEHAGYQIFSASQAMMFPYKKEKKIVRYFTSYKN